MILAAFFRGSNVDFEYIIMSHEVCKNDRPNVAIQYWTYSENKRHSLETGFHKHPHWQLDYIVKGNPVVTFDSAFLETQENCVLNKQMNTLTTSPGQIVLIPPLRAHNYGFMDEIRSNLSIKFEVHKRSDTPMPMIIAGREPRLAGNFLLTILQNKTSLSISERHLAEYNLAALVHMSGVFGQQRPVEAQFIMALREVIHCRNGKPLKVSEAARRLGYSRNHASNLFRKTLGIPLKTFIDNERAKIAKDLLAHSELNISQIASYMGFKDVFSFSRFFRRNEGICPSEFHRNNSSN